VREDTKLDSARAAVRDRCPANGTLWVHARTGDEYRVLGGCVREKDLVPMVLYASATACWFMELRNENLWCDAEAEDVWCRPLDEFLDGRFVSLE
jgi:hypothetical protein